MKSEFFGKDFIDKARMWDDKDDLIILAADEYQRMAVFKYNNRGTVPDDDLFEAHALLLALNKEKALGVSLPPLSPTNTYFDRIRQELQNAAVLSANNIRTRDQKNFADAQFDKYSALFSDEYCYDFSDSDYARIQQLINEIREIIQTSELIPENHKARLLRRLEATQRELHKKTSDIDRFWGFIGESGIVLRKFGEDLKPLSERITEFGRIILAVVFAKEGIAALPVVTELLKLNK